MNAVIERLVSNLEKLAKHPQVNVKRETIKNTILLGKCSPQS